MLDLKVTKQQGDFRIDISFVAPGIGVTALFGPSGAGKTSVIDMVAGLVKQIIFLVVAIGSSAFIYGLLIHVLKVKEFSFVADKVIGRVRKNNT